MPGTCFRMSARLAMPWVSSIISMHQDLALGGERPDVGLAVVFLLGQAPVAHRGGRAVAADAGGLVERRGREARIAARRDRVAGLVDGGDVRPQHAVDAEVERLLGEPLIVLAAIGRDAHHRRHRRGERAALHERAAIEHVLHAVAQRPRVPEIVLHLVDDAVEFRRAHRDGRLDLGLGERGEGGLAFLPGADDTIQTRKFGHVSPPDAGLAFCAQNIGSNAPPVQSESSRRLLPQCAATDAQGV